MDNCDIWDGGKFSSGYGSIRIGDRNYRAHRIVWMQDNGPIPAGMCVLHTCDTPACIRLSHLWLGTAKDNAQDRDQKHRFGWRWTPQEMCGSGEHRMEGENVVDDGNGHRRCRECRNRRRRKV